MKRGCDDREGRPHRKRCPQRANAFFKLLAWIHIDGHRLEAGLMPFDAYIAGTDRCMCGGTPALGELPDGVRWLENRPDIIVSPAWVLNTCLGVRQCRPCTP